MPRGGIESTYLRLFKNLPLAIGTSSRDYAIQPQRELPSLAKAGIFEERRNGTRTYFRAQQASPTFRNLRGIFAKTQEDRKNPQSPVPKKLGSVGGLPRIDLPVQSRGTLQESLVAGDIWAFRPQTREGVQEAQDTRARAGLLG